eukprot:690830-Prymnesium_polylepis.4
MVPCCSHTAGPRWGMNAHRTPRGHVRRARRARADAGEGVACQMAGRRTDAQRVAPFEGSLPPLNVRLGANNEATFSASRVLGGR